MMKLSMSLFVSAILLFLFMPITTTILSNRAYGQPAVPNPAQQPPPGVNAPCNKDVQKFCKNAKGGEEYNDCLYSHFSMLSTACKESKADDIKNMPCVVDRHTICKGKTSSDNEMNDCLWENYQKLTPSCLSSRKDLFETHPCLVDQAKLCKNAADAEAKEKCIWQHFSTLSPLCKKASLKILKTEPCSVEAATICKAYKAKDPGLDHCLKSNNKHLNAACKASLNQKNAP